MKVSEAVVRRCSVKKVFLKISQNSQENTCARVSFLIKLQAPSATLLKKRLWHRCFPVNFVKFLGTLFFTEDLWWLLLQFWPSESPNRIPNAMELCKLLERNLTHTICDNRLQTASNLDIWNRSKIVILSALFEKNSNFSDYLWRWWNSWNLMANVFEKVSLKFKISNSFLKVILRTKRNRTLFLVKLPFCAFFSIFWVFHELSPNNQLGIKASQSP